MTLAPVALARLGINVTDPVTVSETALPYAEVQGMMRVQENVLHLDLPGTRPSHTFLLTHPSF